MSAPKDRSPRVAKSVGVVLLVDARPPSNADHAGLRLIRLPYGWQDLTSPGTIQRHSASCLWRFTPTEDIAKALAAEIHNYGIFKEACFPDRESEGELLLRGTLTSMSYEGTRSSSGLSV